MIHATLTNLLHVKIFYDDIKKNKVTTYSLPKRIQ